MSIIGHLIDNRYKILDKIGYGGMSTVYLARDIKTGIAVAVKIMNENLTNDPSYVKRFEREAKIGISLDHPNIARVIDYGEIEDTKAPYLVMEYIQGISLTQYIKRKGKLSIKEATDIAIQVLSALSYAYSKGIQAHRDIKPSNIMIETNTNKVKVMDFGIAKTVGSQLTHSTVLYTPKYASPEQLLPSKFNNKIDKRTDIYSMGVVLYEMLTGRAPYIGTTPAEISEQQFKNMPIPPSSIRNDIPYSFSQIILKCLHPDPNKRYQTPEELIRDLRRGRCSKPVAMPSQNYTKQAALNSKTQIGRRGRYNTDIPTGQPSKTPYSTPYTSHQHASNFNPMYVIIPLVVAAMAIIIAVAGIAIHKSNIANNIGNNNINTAVNPNTINNTNNTNKPAPAFGSLFISSTPSGAEIYLQMAYPQKWESPKDMEKVTPATIEKLETGKYILTLKKDNYKPFSGIATIEKGKTKTVNAKLNPISNESKNTQNGNTPNTNPQPTKPTVSYGTLYVSSNPSGAEIYLKRTSPSPWKTLEDKGVKTPYAFKPVKPGEAYLVVLKKQGYKDYQTTATIKAGEPTNVNAKLTPLTGTLSVSSAPSGAKVYINGNYKGTTPLSLSLAPGNYTIKITKANYKDYTKTIAIVENKTTNISATLSPIITCQWKEMNNGLRNNKIFAIAINPSNTDIIYAGTISGISKSTDGGKSWKNVSNGLSDTIYSIAIDSKNPNNIYAAGYWKIYKSNDSGLSWHSVLDVWVSKVGSSSCIAVDSKNPDNIYVGMMNSRIFRSTDGGKKWILADISTGLTGTWFISIAIDPQNTNIIYAGDFFGDIFKSTDRGVTWEHLGINLGNNGDTGINSIIINPKDSSIIYVGTGKGIYKSMNGGDRWVNIARGVVDNAKTLAVDPINPSIVYVGTYNRGIFKSTDGGKSWKSIGLTDTDVQFVVIDTKNPNIIYAGTWGDGIFKYTCASP